ncbi:unnamed protein product [Staurois parvus]|uniref:Secreted protein n=1 Tax=Staurois parvus TaxID=386267 RepID=A0ABN9EZY7_9NEOB|nr:unnamed protein product [Staurois parvus]
MAFNLSCLRFATLPWAPVPPPLAAARSRACVWPSIEAASAPPLCHWTLDSRRLLVVSQRCCWGDFLT